ncbi:MAG: DUF2975 domain-containing protein [Candidatus Glassbacteria bacterium]
MAGRKMPILTRMAVFVVEANWYFTLAMCVFVLIVTVLMIAGPGFIKRYRPVLVPADITYFEKYEKYLKNNEPQPAEGELQILAYFNGVIVLNTQDDFERFFGAGLMLSVVFLWLVLAWNLRKILRSFKTGQPFNLETIRRIRYIGLAVLGMELGNWVIALTTGLKYVGRLNIPEAEISLRSIPNIYFLLLGLLILVLAQIFELGVRLQEDSDLTV